MQINAIRSILLSTLPQKAFVTIQLVKLLFCSSLNEEVYRSAAPKMVLKATTPVKIIGARLNSPFVSLMEPAAPDWVELAVEEVVAVAVAEPEPGVAVPELCPPAFWEPSPVRPGPVPAPWLMYLTAPDGIAGSSSPLKSVTSQWSPASGQVDAVPSDL